SHPVDRQTVGRVELRCGARAAIARKSCISGSCDRRDDAVASDLSDSMIRRVSDVQVAVCIRDDSFGLKEQGGGCRAVIAGEIAARDGRDGIGRVACGSTDKTGEQREQESGAHTEIRTKPYLHSVRIRANSSHRCSMRKCDPKNLWVLWCVFLVIF